MKLKVRSARHKLTESTVLTMDQQKTHLETLAGSEAMCTEDRSTHVWLLDRCSQPNQVSNVSTGLLQVYREEPCL
jgi:hypothetical protein